MVHIDLENKRTKNQCRLVTDTLAIHRPKFHCETNVMTEFFYEFSLLSVVYL